MEGAAQRGALCDYVRQPTHALAEPHDARCLCEQGREILVALEAAEDDYDEYDEDVDEGDENMEKTIL